MVELGPTQAKKSVGPRLAQPFWAETNPTQLGWARPNPYFIRI